MVENDPVLAPLAGAAETAGRSGTTGRRCTTRRGWRPMRCRPRRPSTTTTCTCRRAIAADRPAAIRGLRPWVTNEYEHDGLRVSDGEVLDRLIAMVRGNA